MTGRQTSLCTSCLLHLSLLSLLSLTLCTAHCSASLSAIFLYLPPLPASLLSSPLSSYITPALTHSYKSGASPAHLGGGTRGQGKEVNLPISYIYILAADNSSSCSALYKNIRHLAAPLFSLEGLCGGAHLFALLHLLLTLSIIAYSKDICALLS